MANSKIYTNNTDVVQVIYDQWGDPRTVQPGETVVYEGDTTCDGIDTSVHKHDCRYYTREEVDALVSGVLRGVLDSDLGTLLVKGIETEDE